MIGYLRNTSRAFIYSTGLSPANVGCSLEALKIAQNDKDLRKRLLQNASYLREGLKGAGFQVNGLYQIMTIMVEDNIKVMKFQKLLEERGIFVTGIRPPTVPTARLRISVMAVHTKKQLDAAIDGFKEAGKELGLI